jgi:hypothetical protein
MVPLLIGHRDAVGRLIPLPASPVEGHFPDHGGGRARGGWGSDINIRVPFSQALRWESHSYQFHMWESHSTTTGSQYYHKVIL